MGTYLMIMLTLKNIFNRKLIRQTIHTFFFFFYYCSKYVHRYKSSTHATIYIITKVIKDDVQNFNSLTFQRHQRHSLKIKKNTKKVERDILWGLIGYHQLSRLTFRVDQIYSHGTLSLPPTPCSWVNTSLVG